MAYRMTCPNCGTRLSRFDYCTTTSLHFTCRKCAVRFCMTPFGWFLTILAVVLEIVCMVSYILRLVSSDMVIVLVVGICALAIWLIPVLAPVRLSDSQ